MKPIRLTDLYWGFSIFIVILITAIVLQKIAFLAIPFAALITYIATYNLKVIWFLLIASIPFSFEMQINESLGLDMPAEPIMLLLTGIFILLIFTNSVQIQKAFLLHPISICLACIFLWSIVTASFSTIPFFSFKYLLAKVWFIIPFVIMPWFFVQQKNHLHQFALTLIITISITVLYVLYNHFGSRFSFDNINNAVAPFYRNHVNYAALLVCSIPVIVLFYLQCINIKYKNTFLALLIIFLFALATSYSRGAWLALAASVVSIYLVKKRLLAVSFLVGIAIAISSFFVLANNNKYLNYHPNYKKTIYHGNFNDHINATFAGTDMSNAERINRWIAGVYMLKGNLLVGYGPNTFYNNYKPFMVTYFKTWVSNNPEKSTAHNYFLLTLIEQGIIGFVLLLALVFTVYGTLEKAYRQTKNKQWQQIIQCIAAIFTITIVLNMLSDLVETDKIGSIFYLCIGITVFVFHYCKKKIID